MRMNAFRMLTFYSKTSVNKKLRKFNAKGIYHIFQCQNKKKSTILIIKKKKKINAHFF